MYQGTTERRVRVWLQNANTPAARVWRLFALFSPLGLLMAMGIPVCPTAAIFRLPCPGCGLTRATWALAQGDLHAASALNPIAAVVCPVLVAAFGYGMLRYVWRGRVDADRWGAGPLLIVSMTALTVIWVVRWFGYFGGPVPV